MWLVKNPFLKNLVIVYKKHKEGSVMVEDTDKEKITDEDYQRARPWPWPDEK